MFIGVQAAACASSAEVERGFLEVMFFLSNGVATLAAINSQNVPNKQVSRSLLIATRRRVFLITK